MYIKQKQTNMEFLLLPGFRLWTSDFLSSDSGLRSSDFFKELISNQ